ncbi:response regulator [Paenibacillus thalictri]|uniref:response regulator n=1 Tax=Paenibacillus thalictri TaxID=2527873 RepID=UPI001F0DA5F2|nr:response regulator [Paenibacillus thalictri]
MYSCLIVDDEDLILQRLEQFFAGPGMNRGSFRLAGKAYSGHEGIAMALELKPDIVITDIVMPGMNGLEMIEQLRNRLPHANFIILSAYSDFHYAKRAIQNNVSDYLIKVPLNEDDLRDCLDKAAKRLSETEQKESEVRELNISMLENQHRIRKQFFTDLLQGAHGPQRAAEFAAKFKLNLQVESYCCFVVEMNDYPSFRTEYGLSDQNVLKYGLSNILEETIAAAGAGFASELEGNRFVGFVSWPSRHSALEWERQCQELGRQVVSHVKQYLKRSVSVGFSGRSHGWSELVNSYRQAKASCDDSFYWGAGLVITPSQSIQYHAEDEPHVKTMLGRMLQQIEPGITEQELVELISAFQSHASELKMQREAMTKLLRECLETAKGKMRAWQSASTSELNAALEYLPFREQLSLIKEHLLACMKSNTSQLREEIVKAKLYIERNMAKKLSLQQVADAVNLTPAYFSSLFKKEMNQGLVEYVNQRKIERSLELLQQKDYTNQELCDALGIANEAYFCTLFKQITGCSPKQYRRKVLQC